MKNLTIKSKTEKVLKHSNSYFEYPLKYVGFGELHYHRGIFRSRIKVYKGYELSGIRRMYLNNKLFFVNQIKKGINHGTNIQLWRIK